MALVVAAVALVVAVPVALAIAAAVSGPSDEPTATAPSAPDEPGPSAGDELPPPPDPGALTGRDAALARLLGQVHDSENAMIAFQDRVAGVLDDPDDEPARLLEEVRAAAEESAAALADVRPRLVEPLEDTRVEEVRIAYLAHHDAWADYLDAVAEDPAILGDQTDGSRWQLSINLSAEVFARQLREELEEEPAEPVRSYATELLRRGFERPESVPDA